MRTRGELTQWNDQRGFGFITPEGSTKSVFVHISAFSRPVPRPQRHDHLSFEIETDARGQLRAIRVLRAGESDAPSPLARPRRPPQQRRSRGVLGPLTAVALLIAGVYAYDHYRSKAQRPAVTRIDVRQPDRLDLTRPDPFRCDGRTRCGQMHSCAEAKYFLNHCPGTEMDGDRDGIPCEQQWCG